MVVFSRSVFAALFSLLLSACSSMPEAPSTFAAYTPDAAVLGKWARSCALCHVNGEAGAPLAGDVAAWKPRLAQGEEVVMQHVLEGYNAMPALGYCMACEIDDFKAMTAFMAGVAP